MSPCGREQRFIKVHTTNFHVSIRTANGGKYDVAFTGAVVPEFSGKIGSKFLATKSISKTYNEGNINPRHITYLEGSQNSIVPRGIKSAVPSGLNLTAARVCLQMFDNLVGLIRGSFNGYLQCSYLGS